MAPPARVKGRAKVGHPGVWCRPWTRRRSAGCGPSCTVAGCVPMGCRRNCGWDDGRGGLRRPRQAVSGGDCKTSRLPPGPLRPAGHGLGAPQLRLALRCTAATGRSRLCGGTGARRGNQHVACAEPFPAPPDRARTDWASGSPSQPYGRHHPAAGALAGAACSGRGGAAEDQGRRRRARHIPER